MNNTRKIHPQDRWILNSSGNIVGVQSADANSAMNVEGYDLPTINPVTGEMSGLSKALKVLGGHSLTSATKRTRALARWQGICKNGTPFNITPSTGAYTQTVKLEVEAPFHSVAILADNGAPNAQTTNKVAVGVTETNAIAAYGSFTLSQAVASPIIGGVCYDSALATSGNLGYKQVTWSGSGTYGMPAGNTARQYKISDDMPLQSVPRADGGSRPLLLIRTVPDTAGYNFLILQALNRTATAANRGRTLVGGLSANDGITTLNVANSLNNSFTDAYPILSFTVPVLSVWGVGDSIMQGNSTAIIPDGFSNYVARACASVSTLAKPVVYANLSANSQTADYYWTNCKALLAAGVPAPSVIVTGPASCNDGASSPTVATLEAQRARAYDMIATAKQYGIPYLIWVPWLPNENLTNVASTYYDDKRKQVDAELKALAEANGVYWLDLNLGDGASPEKWNATYKYDAFHPNETAHEYIATQYLASVLSLLNGGL